MLKLAAAEIMGEKKMNIFKAGIPAQYSIMAKIGKKIWLAPKSGSMKTRKAGMATMARGGNM